MQPKVSTAPANDDLGRMVEELKRELSEAHRREAATLEVLKLLSRSPSELQPVFETVVRNAAALCGSRFANVFRFDGELLHLGASNSSIPEFLQMLEKRYPMRPDLSQVSGRVVLKGDVVRIEDAFKDAQYDSQFAIAGGWRRMVGVPMLLDGKPVGAIVVAWADPGPIPKVQEQLLQTFADQVVIAIENARLFEGEQASKRELQESLEYQIATSEVLGAISRSPSELQPVLEAIVSTAARLCNADTASLLKLQEGRYHLAATDRAEPAYVKYLTAHPISPGRESVSGRVALERSTVHIIDALTDPEYTYTSYGKTRTKLGVPREVGAIWVAHTQPNCERLLIVL